MADATTTATAAPSVSPVKSTSPQKSFDVAIVDHVDSSIEHWPRFRVTVDADSHLDKPASPAEKQAAIAIYNQKFGLSSTTLPYDVRLANGSAPVLPKEWTEHMASAEYWKKG